MSDITGAGKIAEAAERVTREIRELLRDLMQPAARELGEHFADRVRLYREQFALKALLLARNQIDASGLPRVPLTVKESVLLLEGASLEEDEYLTSQWAGLIASAATVGGVLPAFADILRQLTPEEGRILDHLYENALTHGKATGRAAIYVEDKESLQKRVGLTDAEFIVRIQNLHRLELIVEHRPIIGREPTRGMEGWKEKGPTGLTALGSAFVRACRGPLVEPG